ncbi:MAG: peptidylprolyl isomerase [Alphaproteobacteria bacterium]|nr:peptidylprolyl isomerase [Alphaproteobacteria bacterium]
MIAHRQNYNADKSFDGQGLARPALKENVMTRPLFLNNKMPRLLAMLTALTLSWTAMAQDEASLEVLTINDQPYTLNLVGNIINQLPDNIRQQPIDAYYDSIIDDIIDTKLSADAARQSGLAEKPLLKEIAMRAYERVIAEAWLNEELNRRITDDMIAQSYNDLLADTESRTETKASHILVDSEADAMAVIARLDQGEDFAAIAKEVSTGPSGPNGGALGYFRRGDMVPSFELASFNLEVGTYTKTPVQTRFGWHVIQVSDRRVADAPPLADIEDQLRSSVSVKIIGTIISELRAKASITRLTLDDVRAADNARQSGN